MSKQLSTMSFIPKLQKFINDNGSIYTVRRYKYDNDVCIISGVGKCKRELIFKLNSQELNMSFYNTDLDCNHELEDYVNRSGFDNLEDWITMIKKFVGNTYPLYLYEVEKIKE